MSNYTLKNFVSRMSDIGATSMLSLALLAGFSACSSNSGATKVNEVTSMSPGDLQDDESAMLGSVDSSDTAAPTGNEEVVPSHPAIDSLPVEASNYSKASRHSTSAWHGKLKTKYQSGMSEWTVSRGESLSLIATAVYGKKNSWKELQKLNPQITDANALAVGQKLKLPGAAAEQADEGGEASAAAAVAQKAPAIPTISNDNVDASAHNPPDAAPPIANNDTTTKETAAAGAMGTVTNNDAPPPPPSDPVTKTADPKSSGLGNLITTVDTSGNKLKMRNLLLGVAGFFLLLSGVIFIMSRRKSRVAG